MKYIIIKDCRSCPNKHLDHRYFSCHKDREAGWWCNLGDKILLSIKNLDIPFLSDNFIPDWCPLDDLGEK